MIRSLKPASAATRTRRAATPPTYYDGVRRIAEVHRDPLAQAGIGGNPNPQGSHTTYTDREYVWGPDYVDECLWQIDRPGNTAFVLQEANFNVVGLTDPQGALLQQYDYDPYGTPTGGVAPTRATDLGSARSVLSGNPARAGGRPESSTGPRPGVSAVSA